VGTGNGIQALFAAQHCKHVIATDVSQRALDFAEFNARLNGVDNIEFRRGSFFEPVEGERFDLVLCNPPYLISPDSLYAYRDSGMGGDTVSSELVRRAPEFLVEGGFAHLLASWIRREGDEWSERLRDWTEGSGCDAFFLHYQTEAPIDHAESWLAPLAAGPLAEYELALDRWLEYFSQEGIASISHGAVTLRRRTAAKNWIRAEELPTNRLLPASLHMLRIVAAEDFLAELARPEDLLDEWLALVEAHQLDQRLAAREGALGHVHTSLLLEEGLGFVIGIDLETAELLPALDGSSTAREALAARAPGTRARRRTPRARGSTSDPATVRAGLPRASVVVHEPVAHTPAVHDERAESGRGELPPQPRGVRVERARAAERAEAPDLPKQLLLREYPRGLREELQQELVLLACELDTLAAHRDSARRGVDVDGASLEP
jgi:hypothetical protein